MLVNSSRDSVDIGAKSVEVGRLHANVAEFRATSTDIGRIRPGVYQIWADTGRLGSTSARFGRCLQGSAEITKVGAESTKFGPRSRPVVDHFWPDLEQKWATRASERVLL